MWTAPNTWSIDHAGDDDDDKNDDDYDDDEDDDDNTWKGPGD